MESPPKISGPAAPTTPANGGSSGTTAGPGGAARLSAFNSSYPQGSGAPSRFGPVLVQSGEQPPTRFEIWSNRLFLVIRVIFWIELGMWLVVVPWTKAWTDSDLLLRWPGLRALLQQGFARGATSGLGLLDIWIGIWDAVHYRDPQ